MTLWGVRIYFGIIALPGLLVLPWGNWGWEFVIGTGCYGAVLGIVWWLTARGRGWVPEQIGDFM